MSDVADTDKLLADVAALLATPERWTQGTSAREETGLPCPVSSPIAVAWCMQGAFLRLMDAAAVFDRAIRANRNAVDLLEVAIGRRWVTANDDPSTTHADVLAWIAEARRLNMETT